MTNKIQAKASNNPKQFWQAINELQGKFTRNPSLIVHNDKLLKNETEIAEAFADFFKGKVDSLAISPIITE